MEQMEKRQKRFLTKWTVIMGLFCGLMTGIIILSTSQTNLAEGIFWFQTIAMAMGGGIVLGLIPAILVEYRRTSNE